MGQVLIIDDSSVLRAIQMRVLRASGLAIDEVVEAHDAQSALALFSEHADIVLVLLDNDLPGAAEFVRVVRRGRERADVPIVLVSSRRSSPAAAMKAGANAFLARPFCAAEARVAARASGG